MAQARLNLSYTHIYATETGTIANKTVETGDFVQPGQTLFSIVPKQTYIISNYKETQLTYMRPGQAVGISVDGFPNLHLTGHIDSVQRGTGSIFASIAARKRHGQFCESRCTRSGKDRIR